MMTTEEQRQFQDLLAGFKRGTSRPSGGRPGRGRGGGVARKRAADGPIPSADGKRVR